MFCDLDDFKTINDSLGHAAGDELLVAVASASRAASAPATPPPASAATSSSSFSKSSITRRSTEPARRILEALGRPFKVRGRDVVVGVSIGIAAGSDSAEDMLRNADLALYRAKDAGKGRFEVFEPRMHTAMVERLELEGELRLALRRNELRLDYQPIVRLVDGRIEGVEALVRWQHPERGLLQPDDFIPIAEDSRLVVPLGRWVLEEACRQAMLWEAALPGDRAPAVSVNLSGVELAAADTPAFVASILRQTGLAPEKLMLELTETALVKDTDLAIERLSELKALGVRLAVDDFGTGYASLQHLRGFPVDVIKIAKPFVDDVAGGAEESAARPGDHRSRHQLQSRRHRRGDRDDGAARAPDRPRLRPRPGVPLRAAPPRSPVGGHAESARRRGTTCSLDQVIRQLVDPWASSLPSAFAESCAVAVACRRPR